MIAGLPKRPRVADLSGVTLTLDQMAFLGKQRTLVGLQLQGCPIGDEQVAQLCSLDRMANLDLSDTLLTDRALEALVHLVDRFQETLRGPHRRGPPRRKRRH